MLTFLYTYPNPFVVFGVLIEAKWCGAVLDKQDSQLFRYFGTTTAKFGILTNGIIYKFYTDLDQQNKMDLTPFMELDVLNIKDSLVPELKRFCKANFDIDEIFNRASELKYSNEIKAYFSGQLRDTNDDFVNFMLSHVYEGKKTAAIVEKFRPIVKSALNTLISEMMSDRITTALKNATPPAPVVAPVADDGKDTPVSTTVPDDVIGTKIVTTPEELEGYYFVKAILAPDTDITRVTYKDTASYFAILYDGMVTKWICRLRLTSVKKYLILPDDAGKPVVHEISGIDEIFSYRDVLIATAQKFSQQKQARGRSSDDHAEEDARP